MTSYLLQACIFANCDEDFKAVLENGVEHYNKYINQMLADCGEVDLPLVMACLEVALRHLKETKTNAVPLMGALTDAMGAISFRCEMGGDSE